MLPTQSRIQWEVNDCGENDGSGTQGDRDMPLCVEAIINMPVKRELSISINVGTIKKGVQGKPTVFFIAYNDGINIDRVIELHELPLLIRK